jgi:2-amino-4-hydroxy-6-hydroxymethyldihydropteridine diphosphokinase
VTRVYLGLGSNVGDREAHLAHALDRLGRDGRLTGLSSVYQTDPVGFLDQPPFLNMVARLETDRAPDDLLWLIRDIEAGRGRERVFPDAPRTLDIDVLLYGDRRLRMEGLTVPHPRMHLRPFVLVPLLELEPGLREPGTGRAYREILDALPPVGDAAVEAIMPGDRLLDTEAGRGEATC